MNGSFQTRAWLILLAMAGAVLIVQMVERSKGWTARSRAEQLGKELLEAKTPEQATAVAQELGDLDEIAVVLLAQGLISDEPFISAAASEQIGNRIGAWRKLPRKTSGGRVAALVKELAAVRDSIPPEQHLRARRWAEAILVWPLQGSSADSAAVLTDCEAILELALPDQDLVDERLARLAQQQANPTPTVSQPEVELPSVQGQADESAIPAPIVSPKDARLRTALDPAPEADPAETSLPPHPREPRGIYVPRARPIEDAAAPEEPLPLPEQGPVLVPPVKASAEADELAILPAIEVMRDLHAESRVISAAAEKELGRRGYKAAQVALARQLTSPDPAVRLKLAQSLPQTRGIDPRPWLLHLADDPDQRVRSAALGILRTSQDPELLQKLR